MFPPPFRTKPHDMRILLQTNYKGFTRLRQLTGYTPDENGVDFVRVRVSGHGIIITSMGIAIAAAAVVVVMAGKGGCAMSPSSGLPRLLSHFLG